MNLVYIASPLAGDIEGNIQKALGYCRLAAEQGVAPVAPHTIFTRFLDDHDPAERKLGLKMGFALLTRCDELWVFGDIISAGMRSEITIAEKHDIPVRYFDTDGNEVEP